MIESVKTGPDESMPEMYERIRIMLDSSPLCAHFWDENLKIIDCNQAAVKMFNLSSKQEYIDKYFDLIPEYQPDGVKSIDKLKFYINKTYEEGNQRLEWLRQSLDKEPIPVELTLVLVDFKGKKLVVGYNRDLREYKKMMKELEAAQLTTSIVFESNPQINILFDSQFKVINCNPAAVKFWGFKSKQEFLTGLIKRVRESIPVRQPNGRLSASLAECLLRATKNDHVKLDTELIINGNHLSLDVEFKKIPYENDFAVVCYINDMTSIRERERELMCIREENELQLAKINMAVKATKIALWEMEVDTDPVNPVNRVSWSDELRHQLGFQDTNDFPDAVSSLQFILHPDDKQKTVDALVNHLSDKTGKTPYDMEYRALKKNGEYGFYRGTGETVRDANGNPIRVVGTQMDITEEKRNSLNNELQLAKLNLVVKATKIILWDMEIEKGDPDPVNNNRGFSWSDDFRHLLGFNNTNDFPNLVGSIHSIMHPDDKEINIKALESHLLDKTGKTPYNVEFRLMKKNGEYAYFRSSGETIRDKDGDAVRVAGALMDVTDTKKILLNNELQLAKLNMVVKATKIGLWDMEVVRDDPVNPGNAFTWSQEFRHMLGYNDESDFPNLFSSWSDRIHPDDKEKIITAFEKHIVDTTGATPYDIEYRMFKKDGRCAYFRDCGETIRDEHGNPIRVAGALLDVTDVKNLLNETEKQRMEAEAANKAKSAFLSTMSHEIRTPMNAILGITEMLLQDDNLPNTIKEALGKISGSGDLLLGIINDILDLSKIEAGKMEILIGKYEITSLISDTAQLNIMHVGSKPIEFELCVDENMPAAMIGDELRIKQIMNNLLSNAFKYTLEGVVKMSVCTESIAGRDDMLTLAVKVSDTGPGMTKEQVAKLFDEYARFNLDANRTTEGTGLGMSITRKLIQMMGGEILIESELGSGSAFTVRLPQGIADSGVVVGRDVAENLRHFRTYSKSRMKRVQLSREPMPYGSVLIVDDVETNIYVAKGLMAPYKLKIDSADSGFSAIDKVKRGHTYDVIFMDHMMPKMDGVEATKIIRDMGYNRSIVALTANAVAGQADMFLQNGFDEYISKPIDIRQLNAILNKLIRDKQTPETIREARKQAEEKNMEASGKDTQQDIELRTTEYFLKDAQRALSVLETISEGQDYGDEENKRSYIISMHGIKGALANIGEKDLSSVAQKLEMAGREGKLETLSSLTPVFIGALKAFVEKIRPKEPVAEDGAEDIPYLKEVLLVIKSECEKYNGDAAEEVLAELRKMPWSRRTKELLDSISGKLLHSDFDEVADNIKSFMETL